MKNIKIIILLLIITFTSCKREGLMETITNSDNVSYSAFKTFVEGEPNDELKRLFNDLNDCENYVNINFNVSKGEIPVRKSYAAVLSGKAEDGLTVKINSNKYFANNKNWLKQDEKFMEFYGKTIDYTVYYNGELVSNKEFYSPKILQINNLNTGSSTINRAGNQLSWIPDVNNLSKKIALFMRGSNEKGFVDSELKFIDDDGSYNIDEFLSNKEITALDFNVIRGTGFSLVINGQKTRFSIKSEDVHSYKVVD
jgi:hypothetical protein